MKKTRITLVFALCAMMMSCATLQGLKSNYMKGPQGGLSIEEIAKGLKEALRVGTENSVNILHKKDGFLADAAFKILFPPSAQKVADKLRAIGMGSLVEDFIVRMNRGAEKAVKEAVPIFVKAITSMTFEDAKKILEGPDNAATEYFRQKTTDALVAAFGPPIRNALDSVGAATLWTKITTTYNRIPFIGGKVETDIVRYVCDKALYALFKKIEVEEKKIRQHPAARVTALLAKVFGSLKR